jgi:hypothetical protein
MSVARCGLPHTTRSPTTATVEAPNTDRTAERDHPAATTATAPTGAAGLQPTLPGRTATGRNGSGPQRDSRARVRELVACECASGVRLAARQVAAAVGISERRAYELLRNLRAEATTQP